MLSVFGESGGGLDTGDVTTSEGFRDSQGNKLLSGEHLRHNLLLDFLTGEVDDLQVKEIVRELRVS